jgi:hypothetical protein
MGQVFADEPGGDIFENIYQSNTNKSRKNEGLVSVSTS